MNLLPLYRRPIFRTCMGLILWVALYWLVQRGSGYRSAIPLIFDLLLGILAFILFLGLAAQFVLPVASGKEWVRAWIQLLRSTFGLHSAMIAVRNGQIEFKSAPGTRRGASVILIDSRSAVVLQTDTELLPPQGPGIAFSSPEAQLAACLDLRPQLCSSTNHAGAPRTQRASAATAITKDGIPISADLRVIFILDPGPEWADNWRTGLHPRGPAFNPHAAEQAVLGHAYGNHQDLPWKDLPLTLALDLWREEVHALDLETFFGSSQADISPLEKIQQSLIASLSAPLMDTGSKQPANAILESRGVRVLDVAIENLQLPLEIQNERNAIHLQNMAQAAQKRIDSSREVQMHAREQGRRQAAQRILESATTSLRTATQAGADTDPAASLCMILDDTAVLAAREGFKLRGIPLAQFLQQLSIEIRREFGSPEDLG